MLDRIYRYNEKQLTIYKKHSATGNIASYYMKRFHLFDPFLLTININYFCDGYKQKINKTNGR